MKESKFKSLVLLTMTVVGLIGALGTVIILLSITSELLFRKHATR